MDIVCYKHYFYLHRLVGKFHYLGRFDLRFGWIIKKLSPENFKAKTKKVKEEDYTYQGHVYAPFSKKDVKKFEAIEKSQLDKFYEDSKNKNYI